MNHLLFVVNPISGGIDKSDLHHQIDGCCKTHQAEYSIIETKGKNDKERIADRIKELSPDIVIACGGDGTINLVANVLLGKDNVKLGILPLGSANGLATELDIPEDIEGSLEIILAGKTIHMDVLRINKKYISLHLSDIGFNAALIKRFEASGSRGKLAYARHFFATLFKKKTRKYQFDLGYTKFNQRAEMVVFANATKYGTGAVVNPEGHLDDGKFEICIFKPSPWYAMFSLAYHFFTGQMKRSRYVSILSAEELHLSTKKSDILQIDGEDLGEYKKVHVQIEPAQLHVIRG
ncbi:diacylglycerol/lipid kinase family protein [Fulvivirga sediminis]|uniref:YegS/Rv2252/BmrU family lipid kinase n=1 Tax=Fulvivirga sediminis TaxID=2803949 RepID=A0A937F2V0_9BACT|nr:YegS/Rv2252/BmrU family lipid kinase [Fulvivirga sediminis]MBL3654710.1 YegS/Rv2252/BmrU family lipid kinase [Fulvivirga sediminis]